MSDTGIDWDKILPLIGNGGGWAVVIYLMVRIGNSIVAALRELSADIKNHTKDDLDSQAAVKQDIVRMDARQESMDRKLDYAIGRMDSEIGSGPIPKRPGTSR